jgi:hypothetical protein
LETFDSAAIYASDRDWTMRGTSMTNNLIYAVGNASTVCNSRTACARHAIYLDSLTDGFNVTGNVIVQSDALKVSNANGEGILDNGGRDNVVDGNLCIGWGLCISSDAAGLTWYAPGTGNYGNELRLLKAGLANVRYTERYPAMAALDDFVSLPLLGNCSARKSCGPAPWGNAIRGNVALNASTTPPFDGPRGCVELPQEAQVRKTPCWPLVDHNTASIEPTKDRSLCSIKVVSEKNAELAQKLGQLQPFIAVFPQ